MSNPLIFSGATSTIFCLILFVFIFSYFHYIFNNQIYNTNSQLGMIR